MKIVYRTIDGELFDEEMDAIKHERTVLSQVKMFDRQGHPVTATDYAYLIHLSGEKAGRIFAAMVEHNPEEYQDIDSSVIDEDDTGWFYWDESDETYHCLYVEAIVSALNEKYGISQN